MTKSLLTSPFLSPRYWPGWLGIGALRIISALPQSLRMSVGKSLGRLAYTFGKRRRHITEANIRVCFPQMAAQEQSELVKKHFESLGMALVETGIAWWEPHDELDKLIHVEGFEHIQAAQDAGEGIILLSAHFTSLELGNRMMTQYLQDQLGKSLDAMYQKHKHAFKEHIISHYRDMHMGKMIPESDIRQLVRVLRNGGIVWYASDQGYHDKNHVIARFFGEPATGNTALSRLAKVSGARVIPYFIQRMDDGHHYLMRLQAPLENFPSGDDVQDVETYHQLIEEHTLRAPEQYLWSHRRFKKRPPEYPDIYR